MTARRCRLKECALLGKCDTIGAFVSTDCRNVACDTFILVIYLWLKFVATTYIALDTDDTRCQLGGFVQDIIGLPFFPRHMSHALPIRLRFLGFPWSRTESWYSVF